MTFRANFIINSISTIGWVSMNLGFYLLIFMYTNSIVRGTGWGKYQFFVFLATTLLINSVVQAFFMPNAQEFSELIRTGGLDFAMLKPIDTQFLISMRRVEWASLSNFFVGTALLGYSLFKLDYQPGILQILLYPVYVLCGIAILYSLMITLAATSIWLGRNQTLYDFWFYITNFSRYPMEIYSGRVGTPLRIGFTYLIPILVVVNVPAKMLAKPLSTGDVGLAAYAFVATAGSLLGSRWLFQHALQDYRSASS